MQKYILLLLIAVIFYQCSEHQHHENEHHEHNEHKHTEVHHAGQTQHKQEEVTHHHQLKEIIPRAFHEVIHTSGELIPAPDDEILLTARHSGIIVFNDKLLVSGKKLNKGDRILTISGKDLIHDNLETGYLSARADFKNAQADFNRAKKLLEDQIIPEKEYLDIKAEYEKALNHFQNVNKYYEEGGQKVKTPVKGYIKDIMVKSGEYVEMGQTLMVISSLKKLILKVDVPFRYYGELDKVHGANFVTPYDDKIYSVGDLNGRLISYGKTLTEKSFFAPVYFELTHNEQLVTGSFVEVYLKLRTTHDRLVVPRKALMEEQGKFYVFVYEDGEFHKHYVKTGGTDGYEIVIHDGIEAGSVIATKNVYEIKLSQLETALPAAHSHNH